MYVIERSYNYDDENRPYYLIEGSESTAADFRNAVGAMALESLRHGRGDTYYTGVVIENMLGSADRSDSVTPGQTSREFERLLDYEGEKYLDWRRNTVMTSASEGHMTLAALGQEIETLRRGDEALSQARYITADGYVGRMHRRGIIVTDHDTAETLPVWVGDDDIAVRLAAELDADTFRERIALREDKPDYSGVLRDRQAMIADSFEHIELGRTDEMGDYHPVVTVLDDEHPLRVAIETDVHNGNSNY